MELKQLTQIQDKISFNRKRRVRTLQALRKVRSGNSAQGRTLSSQKENSSSNSGQDRLVVSGVKNSYQLAESPEQILKRIFSESGWLVRSHFNDPKFRIQNLDSRMVAFAFRDENDELQKYSGVLKQVSQSGTALFKLEGQSSLFNTNLIGFMAVVPH